jgi:PAS domain S-box-containing protein
MDNPSSKTDKNSPESKRIQGSSLKNGNAQSNGKLKESEMRYRRLFETAKDGILILDFETGNILEANPFIVNIIDRPLGAIVGKKLWEIGLFSNKEESELAFIELKINEYIRFEDMPIKRRNGRIVEVEFISNVYLENGAKVIQCNIRDITDRKKAENALVISERNLKEQNANYSNLNKEYASLNVELTENINLIQHINNDLIISKNKAEESDHLKSAFLANMSHEIRTPMNAIMGFSELILEIESSNEMLNRYVRIINENTLHLLSVITDIIDISKIVAGQFTMNTESVNINKLLDSLLDTYNKSVDGKKLKLRLSTDRAKKSIQLQTDGTRIQQILSNLLNNAVKFTKEGEIEFGYKLKGDFVEFFVSDTGIGIEPVNQSLIFDEFRQVDSPHKGLNRGNGLGLSISKALVEKLGGTIHVTSELGKGSIFVFTIPIKSELKMPEQQPHD